jgi:cation-transporting ATPase I
VRAAITAGAAAVAWATATATGTRTRAGTVALLALVGAQLGQTAVAGHNDRDVWRAVALSAAVLLAVVQFPPSSRFFGSRPVGPLGLGIAGGATALATAVALLLVRLGASTPAVRLGATD